MPLLEAARDLREQRARGDRRDDAIGQLPAELLDRLVGERLGALGVVGAQVDVHERPLVGGELGAQPVDIVVVSLDRHELRAVDARGQHLGLLEVGGNEDVGVHPVGGRRGGDRVGQVAGRGAGQRLELQLSRAGRGHGDHAVLERVRRVRGSFLTHSSLSPSRSARRSARTSGVIRPAAPPRTRCGGGPGSQPAGSQRSARCSAGPPGCGAGPRPRRRRVRPVGHLERAEAALADVVRVERVSAQHSLHLNAYAVAILKNLRRVLWQRFGVTAPHVQPSPMELPPFRCRGWLAGFHRASPSTPLDASSYVARRIANIRRTRREDRTHRANRRCDNDEPRSSHAEPSEATPAPSARSRDVVPHPPEPDTPNVEVIEAEGLRWINIERPRGSSAAGWRSTSTSTRSTSRTSSRATSGPRSTSTPTTCSSSCTSRASTSRSSASTPPSSTSSSAPTT